MISNKKVKYIFNVTTGLKAAISLILNPKRIDALLKIGDMLTQTKAFELSLEKVKSDQASRVLIETKYRGTQPPISELMQYPDGTLGNEYAKHMTSANLHSYPDVKIENINDSVYLKERSRQVHDVWHALLGYGIEVSDEAALNAFLLAQFQYPISALIVGGAIIHTLFKAPADLPKLITKIIEGWNRGLKAKPILSVKWEEHWNTPVADLRNALSI